MASKPRIYAIVFDLEFTAWEGSLITRWTRPQEYAELVQIGAVKLDAVSLREVDTFEMLVRPRVNMVLSDYLVALTGITNEELTARGVDFITAYRAFLNFIGDSKIYAFGRDDLVLTDNLKLYAWTGFPLQPYVNIIPWFKDNGIDLKGKHACDAGELAGIPFEGRKHTALADARSVAAGISALIQKGASNLYLREGV